MERTTALKEFLICQDYKWATSIPQSLQDDLYNLVDKLAISVRTAFLTILTGFDGISCDPTPEIALDRSKVASVCFVSCFITLDTIIITHSNL